MKMKDISILSLLFFTIVIFVFLQSYDPEAKQTESSQLDGYWVFKTLNGKEQYLKKIVDTSGVSIPDTEIFQLIKREDLALEYNRGK